MHCPWVLRRGGMYGRYSYIHLWHTDNLIFMNIRERLDYCDPDRSYIYWYLGSNEALSELHGFNKHIHCSSALSDSWAIYIWYIRVSAWSSKSVLYHHLAVQPTASHESCIRPGERTPTTVSRFSSLPLRKGQAPALSSRRMTTWMDSENQDSWSYLAHIYRLFG